MRAGTFEACAANPKRCARCGRLKLSHAAIDSACPEARPGEVVIVGPGESLAPATPAAKRAPDFLREALATIENRAAERDTEAERSMGRTVAAFNAITGNTISERDGWLFMAVLKAARACTTPKGRADDYVDGAAYFSLAGESAT